MSLITDWSLLIGALLLMMVVVGSAVERLPVTPAIIYLAAGYLIGPAMSRLYRLNPAEDAALIQNADGDIAGFFAIFNGPAIAPAPERINMACSAQAGSARHAVHHRIAFGGGHADLRHELGRRLAACLNPGADRSAFREWAAETTAYPREVAEMALAPTVADKVEAAYRRGDLYKKRGRMMEGWATYCNTVKKVQGRTVVPIRKREYA